MKAIKTHLAARFSKLEFLSDFDNAELYICSKLVAFQYPEDLLTDEIKLSSLQPHEIIIIVM